MGRCDMSRYLKLPLLIVSLNFGSFLFLRVQSFAFLRRQDNNNGRLQSSWGLFAEAQLATTNPSGSSLFLYYSPNFYRHVVCQKSTGTGSGTTETRVLESFEWLDDAMAAYPEATVVPLRASIPLNGPVVVGGGVKGDQLYNASVSIAADSPGEECLDSTSVGFSNDDILASCRPETLESHDLVIEKLTERLGFSIYGRFPEDDRRWVKERILFLLSPMPPNEAQNRSSTALDWPKAFFVDGYGLGLTARQAFLAIQALRHLLMIHPLEASAKKPHISFFYRDLRLKFDRVDQVRNDWARWLTGAEMTDAATIAFLQSIDVTTYQCQVLLEAFAPSLLSCELEQLWEYSGTRKIRGKLNEDALHCLRMRLRLHPRDIYGMITTTPYITFYSHQLLVSRMNALQGTICLSSAEMRKLHLTNAGLLGVPSKRIAAVVAFLMDEVNLGKPSIRKAIFKLRPIFRYNIEFVKPKLDFLREELRIPPTDVTRIVGLCPEILWSSVERRLRPIIDYFRLYGFTMEEVRHLVVKSPDILTLNLRNNIKPKMEYFQSRMGYSEAEVKLILLKAPRLLLYSVVGSLEPKLQLLEMAAHSKEAVAGVIVDNPGILLANSAQFRRRHEMFLESGEKFEDYFSHRDSVRRGRQRVVARRKKKPIVEIDSSTSTIVRTYASVSDASIEIGVTTINMYSIIRKGRLHKGKYYKYGELVDDPPTASFRPEGRDKADTAQFIHRSSDLNKSSVHLSGENPLLDLLRDYSARHSTGIPPYPQGMENTTSLLYLTSYVSGRTYPPKNAAYHPAKERAGVLAIYVPQFRAGRVKQIVNIVTSYLGLQVLSSPENDDYLSDGMIMVEYKYQMPSRDRCSIFVCFEVLRIFARMLSLEAAQGNDAFTESVILIEIFTDSNYACQMLDNSATLLKWGSFRSKKEFINDQYTPKSNEDILFPLARLYSCLRNQTIFSAVAKKGGARFAKEIRIRFRHQSELGLPLNDNVLSTIGDRACKAAEMQYIKMHEMGLKDLIWRNRASQDLFFF